MSQNFSQQLMNNTNPHRSSLETLMPVRFDNESIIPNGFIFIGLGTHQTSGIGMHVYSHLIPTIERENIDFQDPYIGKWNQEVIHAVGMVARFLYDHTMYIDKKKKYWSMGDSQIALSPYSFQTTTPNKKIGKTIVFRIHLNNRISYSVQIGDLIVDGFFSSKKEILVPRREKANDENLTLANSKTLHVSKSASVHTFLRISFVPPEFNDHGLIKAMLERHLMTLTSEALIKQTLASNTLSPTDFVGLMQWIYSENSKPDSDAKSILSVVRIHNKNLSSNVAFPTIHYYDALDAAFDFNLPENVLPLEYSALLTKEDMEKKLMLKRFDLKVLQNVYFENTRCAVLENPKQGPYLISLISRHFDDLSSEDADRIIRILSSTECIPTTKGMRQPKASFIPSDSLRKDLAIVSLNIKGATNDVPETESFKRSCVSENFLKKIGCRSLDIDSITATQRIGVDAQLKKFVKELLCQPTLSESDKHILRTKKSFQGKHVC